MLLTTDRPWLRRKADRLAVLLDGVDGAVSLVAWTSPEALLVHDRLDVDDNQAQVSPQQLAGPTRADGVSHARPRE